jgi:hypothetical protein
LSFALFPASGRVYIWRIPKGAYNPECLLPIVKRGRGSVMVWAAISWYTILLHTARGYVDKLGNQMDPMIQTLFPNNDTVSQDDDATIHTTGTVQSWFEEHEGELQHLPGQQNHQI